jgi:hypothetical protein
VADRLMRAQVTIPLDSGIPEDSVVNTFYFDDDDDPIAGFEDSAGWAVEKLRTFYNAIDGLIFPATVAANASVKVYDMRDPEPRSPKYTDTIALTPLGGNPLPSEVSLCVSFKASQESGQIAARRRGRIFLGPIDVGACKFEGSQSRPSDSVRFNVAVAASTLQDGFTHPSSPGLDLKWAVYSPTTRAGGATLDDSFHDVVGGWVDDAWDTQRRRGPKPTARTTFS